jgi:hypothetical protein
LLNPIVEPVRVHGKVPWPRFIQGDRRVGREPV